MIYNNYTPFLPLDVSGRMDLAQLLQLNCTYSVTLAPKLTGQWHTYIQKSSEASFVILKARVAPLRQLTLSRLELMGATVTAEIFSVINSSIQCKIDSIHKWCDSQIVLHWLKILSLIIT